jgi:hypothetical protein
VASTSVFNTTRFTSLASGDVIPAVDISDTTQNAHGSLDSITVTNFFATIPVPVVVTSASANALAVGLAGATNPAFQVDASTALSATGLKVKSAAAGGGVALSVSSTSANEALSITTKGSGGITLVSPSAIPAVAVSRSATVDTEFRIDGTATTNSAYIAFAASGANQWALGRGIDDGTVDLKLKNIALSNFPLTIASATNAIALGGATAITSASASSFAVGLAGATNSAFLVNSSTALQAAGLSVTGAVTGGTVALAAIDSGANTHLSISPKGTTGVMAFGGAVNTNVFARFTGSHSVGFGSLHDHTLSPVAGANAAIMGQSAGTINKAGSGTHALFMGLDLEAPTIGAGASTLTLATTLYIGGAPTGATTNTAAWVAAGDVMLAGSGSSLATNATTGFTYLPSCAGTPTGVPAAAGTGRVAWCYDSTNNIIYVYNGAWKKTAALT